MSQTSFSASGQHESYGKRLNWYTIGISIKNYAINASVLIRYDSLDHSWSLIFLSRRCVCTFGSIIKGNAQTWISRPPQKLTSYHLDILYLTILYITFNHISSYIIINYLVLFSYLSISFQFLSFLIISLRSSYHFFIFPNYLLYSL